MDTDLTDDETAELYAAACAEVPSDVYDRPHRVNELMKEKVLHALRMKLLRARVDLEIQSKIW